MLEVEIHKYGRTMAAMALALLAAAAPAVAQVTPAAGYTPPDDTPSIKTGVTIFGDYTITRQPKIASSAESVGR